MKANQRQAQAFVELDLHDDTLLEIRLLPARKAEQATSLRLELEPTWHGRQRHALTFINCGNVSVRIDCDVLGDSLPWNTIGVEAQTEPSRLQRFISAQRPVWGTGYETERISPIPAKLRALGKYTLYHVQLAGGRVEVLATGFTLTRSRRRIDTPVLKRAGRRTRVSGLPSQGESEGGF